MSSALLDLSLETLPAPEAKATRDAAIPTQQDCPLCGQRLVYTTGKHDELYLVVAVFPDGQFAWVHSSCRALVARDKRNAMARRRRMPDCVRCGQPYDDGHAHGNVAPYHTCAVDLVCGEQQEYSPSEPFHSRHWPYDMISPQQYAEGAR